MFRCEIVEKLHVDKSLTTEVYGQFVLVKNEDLSVSLISVNTRRGREEK